MALTKLLFKPGINRETTSYANEGGWFDCDKIRFHQGFPEKIGGWSKYSTSSFLGTARRLHNWQSNDGSDYLGIGTNLKYYIEQGGAFSDITPIRRTGVAGTVTFSATDGSSLVTVNDIGHGATAGSFVTFSNAENLGGNIGSGVLNQEFQVSRVIDANTYEIDVSPFVANASDTGAGGSGVKTATLAGTGVAGTGVGTTSVVAAGTGVAAATFSSPSSDGVGNLTLSGVSTGAATFTAVTQTSSTGFGVGAEFTVTTSGGAYTVDVTTVGSGYRVGEEILIEGQNLGGAQGTNDLTITVVALAGASSGQATHTAVTQTSTSGVGTGAEFTITTDGNSNYFVDITTVGSGYAVGDTITIAGTSVGGATPANDLVLTVTRLSGQAGVSSTGTYTEVSQTSTSGSGTGAEFTITADGVTGVYSVISITTVGSGYVAADTITISGTDLGGNTPENDLVITVDTIRSQTFTVTQTSTSGSGTGAEFEILVDGTGGYSLQSVTLIGTGYAVSDTVTIAGTSLGGATPTNDVTLTVTVLDYPTIAEYQVNAGLNSQVGGVGFGAGSYGGVTGLAATSQLNGSITDSDTTITLLSVAGFNVAGGTVLIDNELITYTGISSNDLTGCTRGVSGTSAAAHTNGASTQLAVGNANPADDFVGWGLSASTSAVSQNELRTWSHDNFGEDLLINPRDDGIYYWDRTTGTGTRAVQITDLGGANEAPVVAKQVLVSDSDRHVIAFGCNPQGTSSVADQDPLLIRFSDQESLTDWAATATNTAGDLRIGSGSKFIQAVETKRETVIFTDKSMHSLRFIGPPFTFGLTQVSANISVISPKGAASVDDLVFWMGNDNFYLYDGRTQAIPCTVRDYVFLDFNFAQAEKVVCGVNSQWTEVVWYYPSETNSSTNGGDDENDRYVIYNYAERVWYYGSLRRDSWIDRGVRQYPIATETDSAGVGYLYNHELGNDADGAALDAFIESSQVDIGDGDRFAFIDRLIPDLTFSGSTAPTPVANFSISTRNYPGGVYLQTDAQTVSQTSTVPVEQFTQQLNMRLRGRSFSLKVDSSSIGTNWRLGAPRLGVRQDGRQ
jgi:hypothetical protein